MAAGWISVAQCLSSVSMSSGLSSGRKEKSLCFSGRPDLRDFIRLRISPELPGPQYFSSLSHACRNAVCFELPSRPLEKPESDAGSPRSGAPAGGTGAQAAAGTGSSQLCGQPDTPPAHATTTNNETETET